MTQAVHLITLGVLGVGLFYLSVAVWMSAFVPSRRDRYTMIACWLITFAAIVAVLYNPQAVPDFLRLIQLPPNPFTVS